MLVVSFCKFGWEKLNMINQWGVKKKGGEPNLEFRGGRKKGGLWQNWLKFSGGKILEETMQELSQQTVEEQGKKTSSPVLFPCSTKIPKM